MTEQELRRRIAAAMLGVGATGEPATSDTPGDEGGLKAVIHIEGGRVIVNFGKSLSWVSMTAEEGRAFAAAILKKVAKLEKGDSA